jgi:aerotolerance regulator-like protein
VSFLAPLWLAVAGAAVVVVVALHLISTQRPLPAPFPTARFVPESEARAATRARRPADLALLMMRILALLLLGAAAARPVARTHGASAARVLLVDRSRSARGDVRDTALALWRPGDALVVFDSAARRIGDAAVDSLRQLQPVGERGALSPALVAAARAARLLAPQADSVDVLIVSPVATDELDAASELLLARWSGHVRIIRTVEAATVSPIVTLESAEADDALRPAVRAVNISASTAAARAPVRVLRRAASPADSAAARAGTAVVLWPVSAGPGRAAGVWAGSATVIAPFSSIGFAVGGDTSRVAIARVVARWSDGRPAAIESALGRGCIRTIGVGVPVAGDVTLQPRFVDVARRLVGSCAGANTAGAASDSMLRVLQRPPRGPPANVRTGDAFGGGSVAAWLVAAAFLLLVMELAVRRSPARAA